jgi:lipoyl-dependent peroxiredoxin
MPTRTSEATWQGTLKEGSGSMKLGSGSYEGPFTFMSRFETGAGTNPEELIGAAEAGCFTMALNNRLFTNGFAPKRVQTSAQVFLEKTDAGMSITRIHLTTEAEAPDMTQEQFQEHAEAAKSTCIVSRALAGVEITMDAKLV